MAHMITLATAVLGGGLLLVALQRAAPDPEPAPEEPERSPDWCWVHDRLEPEEKR